MRLSNHAARLGAGAVIAMLLVSACGSAPPSVAPPTARPTPVITPDPHLTEPATADQIFVAIRVGDLPLNANNATSGDPTSPIVKRINAAIGNWPLIITEFRSSAALRQSTSWDPTKPPTQGNAPYTFVGLNILIEFGPVTGVLAAPDADRQKQARVLVDLVDPLLWPMEQRAVIRLETKTGSPAAGASSSPAVSAGSVP